MVSGETSKKIHNNNHNFMSCLSLCTVGHKINPSNTCSVKNNFIWQTDAFQLVVLIRDILNNQRKTLKTV